MHDLDRLSARLNGCIKSGLVLFLECLLASPFIAIINVIHLCDKFDNFGGVVSEVFLLRIVVFLFPSN
jgi:hypothetical protein